MFYTAVQEIVIGWLLRKLFKPSFILLSVNFVKTFPFMFFLLVGIGMVVAISVDEGDNKAKTDYSKLRLREPFDFTPPALVRCVRFVLGSA